MPEVRKAGGAMTGRENGWYLRSDGYMTSECSYQRIEAMKGNRALDNHGKLMFVKFVGGNETDSRVYVPHPGTCSMKELIRYDGDEPHYRCSACGSENNEDYLPAYCPRCGRAVERLASKDCQRRYAPWICEFCQMQYRCPRCEGAVE